MPHLVLIPSPFLGAGVWQPVADRRRVHSIVFVDALLPGPGAHTPVADASLAASFAALADEDGVLPPWTHWWDDVEDLFPDPWTRARVEADQPRLPSAYLRGTVPTPPGWERARTCYLAFGRTYADEVTRAAAHGWPVRVLDGRHLHMLVDPTGVADAVLDLIGRGRNTGAREPVGPA